MVRGDFAVCCKISKLTSKMLLLFFLFTYFFIAFRILLFSLNIKDALAFLLLIPVQLHFHFRMLRFCLLFEKKTYLLAVLKSCDKAKHAPQRDKFPNQIAKFISFGDSSVFYLPTSIGCSSNCLLILLVVGFGDLS